MANLNLITIDSGKTDYKINGYACNDLFLTKFVASSLHYILPALGIILLSLTMKTAFNPISKQSCGPNLVFYINKKPSIISLKEKEGLIYQKDKKINISPFTIPSLPTSTLSTNEMEDKFNKLFNATREDLAQIENNHIKKEKNIATRKISPAIEGLPLRLTLQGQIILSMFPDGVIQHVLVQYLQCEQEKIRSPFGWFFRKCEKICIERNIKPNKILSYQLGIQFNVKHDESVEY